MRRVKSDELPDWFDLSKYVSAEDLDLLGWHYNLGKRWLFLKLQASDSDKHRQVFRDFTCSGEPLVLIPQKQDGPSGRSGSNPFYSGTPHSELNQVSVCSLSANYCAFLIADTLHDESGLSAKLLSASEYLHDVVNSVGDLAGDDDKEDLLRQPIDLLKRQYRDVEIVDQELHIEVNMFAPDSLIIDDFRKWLKAARKIFDLPSSNLFSDANINSWARNKILPFLDLTTWAQFEGVKIPDPVLGAALFPDEYDVSLSERIAKVVRPKAKWLIRESVIEAIWMQGLEQE